MLAVRVDALCVLHWLVLPVNPRMLICAGVMSHNGDLESVYCDVLFALTKNRCRSPLDYVSKELPAQ